VPFTADGAIAEDTPASRFLAAAVDPRARAFLTRHDAIRRFRAGG
jgi:hypothetical protein